jgi:hypothetical protein
VSTVSVALQINPSAARLYPQYHRLQLPTVRASVATGDVWVTVNPAFAANQQYLIHGDLIELGVVNEVGACCSSA